MNTLSPWNSSATKGIGRHLLRCTHESLISINCRNYHSTTVTDYKKKINKFQISQTASFPSQVHKTKGANIHHLNPKTCVTWTWTQLYILTIIVVVTNKHISNSSAFSHCKVCVTDGILSPRQKINKHQCFCQWNSGRMRTLSPPALPRSRMGQMDSYPLSRMSLLFTMTPALY